jgi:hypothetical protein
MKIELITQVQLEKILEEMREKSQKTGQDPYETYIEEIRKKRKTLPNVETFMEKHHICPKFEGGSDFDENLILLTVEEHIIAHWIRWKVFNKVQDEMAYRFRIGDTAEALKLRALAIQKARQRDKEERKGRYSSDYQSSMGKRGGIKGGKANTKAQFESRQKVGLTYGRQTGLSNQKSTMKEFLACFSIWAYSYNRSLKRKNKDLTDENFILVSPKKAFVDVIQSLNKQVPNSIPLSQISSTYKLVYGTRPQMYGWRIVNKLIRSEFEDGIEHFQKTYSNSPLILDEELLRDLELE